MDKKVKPVALTSRAINDLQRIKEFSINLYGLEKAQIIIDALFDYMEILESTHNKYSEVGMIDDTFSHLKYDYRKLIKGHIKITYREGKSKIYIVRIFDSRQNPKKNL